MMRKMYGVAAWTAVAMLGLGANSAYALTETACPPSGDKQFFADTGTDGVVDSAAVCYDYQFADVQADENVSGNTTGVHYVADVQDRAWRTSGDRYGLQLQSGLNLSNLGQYDPTEAEQGTGGTFTDGILKLTLDPGASTGKWELLAPVIGKYYLVLKTGSPLPRWAAFEIPSTVTSGFWQIVNDAGRGQALSHMGVYAAVPLPAAAWLLLSGLVGLVGIGRRRAR